jgi:hypothetical protein
MDKELLGLMLGVLLVSVTYVGVAYLVITKCLEIKERWD